MSKAKYLKESFKNSLGKNISEIQQEIRKEKVVAAQLLLAFIRGQSKQTHVLRQQKLKIASLETAQRQKKYLGVT